ncbi:MAG TPA: dipeptidase [Candidatus Saccharimonadales bacterium]|nr:dipeptidase [Candidatus Saccharimonadales bacterium]
MSHPAPGSGMGAATAAVIWIGLAFIAACGGSSPGPAEGGAAKGAGAPEAELRARADKLAHELLIVDTHIDVPYRLQEKMEDISQRTEEGNFDYPRAVAGGLNAPFMSIYVPAEYQKTGGAREFADKLIDMVEKFQVDWPDKFAVAHTTRDVREIFTEGKIALPMGMENGAPIEDDLANVKHFKDRGISYITLTHSEDNQICDSSYAETHTNGGLSPFGRQVVAEMNRVGIMVDISHVSDACAEQVLEIAKAPVIASHSSCRAFTPGWERNISDDLIKKVAAGGGVIQINFGSAFLNEEANKTGTAYWNASKAFKQANGLEDDDPKMKAFGEQYWKEHKKVYATLDDVVANIEHVIEIAGVDHVGFGSDFDGVGDSLPEGLKDVSGYPNILYELLKRGHSEDDLRKICGENLMRVWSEVERIARSGQTAT